MPCWRRKVRKIDGKNRHVKVMYDPRSQTERVRVLGHRNTRDDTASKANRARRKPGYWNNPDRAKKRSVRNYRR